MDEGRRSMPMSVPDTSGPHALTLIICTKIERERPELPGTYTGVTNLISARGRPDQRGGAISPVPRFQVEARFLAGLARGTYRFGLRVIVGANPPRMLSSRDIRLVDGRQEVRLVHGWELKRVPAGPIWFESLINDAVVMRVPFTVELVPPPSTELQA